MVIFYTYRLIQEEKDSTEQRAEELESRVGSGSLDTIASRWRTSPPLSESSTPTPHTFQSRDYLQKYHTVSAGLGQSRGRYGDTSWPRGTTCVPSFYRLYTRTCSSSVSMSYFYWCNLLLTPVTLLLVSMLCL